MGVGGEVVDGTFRRNLFFCNFFFFFSSRLCWLRRWINCGCVMLQCAEDVSTYEHGAVVVDVARLADVHPNFGRMGNYVTRAAAGPVSVRAGKSKVANDNPG